MDTFDYIIVGAGSSGSVLASRLSADPMQRVLLIEAGGPDTSPLIDMPRGFGRLLADPNHVWMYQVDKTGGHNAPEFWVRGKTLGGSSSVNGMVWVHGLPGDYDAWERQGCVGWGWPELSRCFKALEDHQLGEGGGRGVGGPVKVTQHPERAELCEAMIAAARTCGLPITEDLNSVDGEGFGYQPRNIWRGRRQSAAKAFLRPARGRANLTVMTDTLALRVVFEGGRAVGVQIRRDGRDDIVRAGREVVLCAGALHSPKLLQLSGVGPADHLRSLGIDVVCDSPDVGENLREHRLLSMQFRVTRGSQNHHFNGALLYATALNYFLFGRGALASAAFEVGGFVKTRPELDRPDAQLGMGPMSLDRSAGRFAMEREPGALCGGYAMRPDSRGSVRITGRDPDAPLQIQPNYLSEESDRRTSVGIVRFTRRLFAQPALQEYVVRESSESAEAQTDDEIIDAFHRIGAAGFHAAGTCRMGADSRSVVDPQLRVRGVRGLRVVDISVMPSLVSGNTNAPAMAMAWRAAELIQSRE